MSFGLTTAINVEDIPLIMRSAARNYHQNARNDEKVILERRRLRQHHPELWDFAAQLLEQCAEILESKIKTAQSSEPVVKIKRAVL
jgi:hypothetical protein